MTKKILYIIIFLIGCPLLFYILISIKQYHSATGFKRKFVKPEISLTQAFKFKHNFIDFAWKPDKEIWIFDYKDSITLWKVDFNLKKWGKVKFNIPRAFKIKLPNINFDALGLKTYITNPWGEILALSDNSSSFFNIPGLNFDETKIISTQSIAVRSFTRINKENRLEINKITFNKKAIVSKRYILPKQIDGVFSADGLLEYDGKNSRLYYMYFHRGSFLCLDTNLNLTYKAKTIDTINTAKIKISVYNVKGNDGRTLEQVTPIVPATQVNRQFTIDNGRMYILSGLKSDNEDSSTFSGNETIDVYLLKDGKYLHSFYLPKYRQFKLNQFKISNDVLIAIYENYIVTFNFKE